jgi:hypothetical protein
LYFSYPGCPEVGPPEPPKPVRKTDIAFIYADPFAKKDGKPLDGDAELQTMREYDSIVKEIKGYRLDIKARKLVGN